MYFTTPTLDFSTHADALSHIIQELYLEYPGLKVNEKIFNVNIVLYVFDLLTKLPTKRWIHHSIPEKNQEKELEFQKEYLDKNPVIKIIHKYLNDFDIEEEKEWKIEKEKLKAKPCELHLSNHTFDPTLSNEQKAYYHYLRGYLYNIFDYYHHLAEKNLSMAIKLNPLLSEAWSELAECYLKKHLLKRKSGINDEKQQQHNHKSKNKNKNNNKDDNRINKKEYQETTNLHSSNLELTLAKYCLERAMKLKPTDKVLNNMALTLRKIKTNYPEYQINIEKSIDLSKKAISYNINNSSSWASLGITYLESFFHITRDINDLKNSLKAYIIAISHCKKEDSLDILLNKSMINLYLENYQDGINDLKLINQYIKEKVYKQDHFPSLSLDNLYQENLNKIKKIEQYLEKTSVLIKNKCNIKDIFFLKIEWGTQNPFTKIIKNNNNNIGNKSFESHDDETVKKSNNINKSKIESSMISSLKQGKNANKYVRLRIISEVTTVFGFNRSFIAVDEVNKYIALSIYNLNNNVGLIGQEILVYEPDLFNIKVSLKNNDMEYNTIRIDLYSQRSLQHYIEEEWLKQNNIIENQMNELCSSEEYTLNSLKRMNLVVNGEFLNDIKDIDYSKIMIDCS